MIARSSPRLAPPLVAGLVLAALVASGCSRAAEDGEDGAAPLDRPGPATPRVVVLLSADSLRADHTSVIGYERDTTPRLRGLAEDAVVYTSASAQAPWTRPSYTSTFTSRYNSDLVLENLRDGRIPAHRVEELTWFQNPVGIPDDTPTLVTLLADSGFDFATVGLADNPNLEAAWNFDRGFDRYSAKAGVSALAIAEKAVAEIDRLAAGDAPFFLFVHFQQPHYPYHPSPPYDALFDEGLAEPAPAEWIGFMLGRNGTPLRTDERFATASARATLREWVLAQYDQVIAETDAGIGRVLDALRERGLYDEALIAFHADHGDEFDDHGGWGHSHQLHEELLHVPLLVKWPRSHGVTARRVETPVSNLDLAPTLLAALGLPPPADARGRDLHPARFDPRRHPFPIAENGPQTRGGFPAQVSIRGPRYKIIRRFQGDDLARYDEAVYDLEADPREQHPLERPEAREVVALRETLERWLDERTLPTSADAAGTTGSDEVELDEDTVRRLRELGYLGDDEDG